MESQTMILEDRAVDLRHNGATYRQVAATLGFADASGAQKAYERGRARQIPPETLAAEIVRALDFCDNEEMRIRAKQREFVYVISAGEIVTKPDGTPLADTGHWLACEAMILKVHERRDRITGIYAPSKNRVELVGYDSFMEAFRNLEAEVAAVDAEVVEG